MSMTETVQEETVRPILDHIIVRPASTDEDAFHGGIMIPDAARRRPSKGIVTAVGPGRRTDRGVLIPMTVQVGDLVHYNRHTGIEVTLGGAGYLVMRDDDVLCVEGP